MRLQILEQGHRPLQKLILSLIRVTSEGQVPGPILVLSYRRELFGKYLAACFQEGMRAAREWSVGEVELFAAFVSKLNACQYCLGDHTAVAVLGMGDDKLVAAVLENWRTALVNEKVRSMLGFLEKLTLAPADVGTADVEPLRAVGLSDRAIEEAIYICFLFSVMDRLADAFDFTLPSATGVQRNGRMLYRLGYRAASIPG
jgi:uncharacterized peroxidase-related enzyme